MEKTSDSQEQKTPITTASYMQWFRESMAAVISLVVLGLAAAMMYGTFSYASHPLAGGNDETNRQAYERQKDIMLYALALLGTVTGYYLGRVPAELHAQSAQRAANTAQHDLQKTQTKLTEAAGETASVATRLTVAEEEKQKAKGNARDAMEALEKVSTALIPASREFGVAGIGEEAATQIWTNESLRKAKSDVDEVLRRLRSQM